MRRVWGIAAMLALAAACSNTVGLARMHSDSGSPADAGVDAGPVDAGPPDAGPPDAGPPDAGAPDAGWSGAWQPFGPRLGNENQVYPALAVDASGALLVAYADLVESPGSVVTELLAVRWSGTAWEPLGGTIAQSDTRFPYSAPLWLRLATDGTGRPVLAFGDSGAASSSGAFPLKTWVFDGSAWQPVPVPSVGEQLTGLALVTGPDGQVRLVVSTGQELDVFTLDGQTWTEAVSDLSHDSGVSEPDLALAGDGSPVVSFAESAAPGAFGPLRAWRWSDGGWTDLGVPTPTTQGLIVHTPRVRLRADGGVLIAASEWQYDPMTKLQTGISVPLVALGDTGWVLIQDNGIPGGFGLSEPIPGAPVGLQLADDVPVVLATLADGGVTMRAIPEPGVVREAPTLDGLGAGTLGLGADGAPLVGAVTTPPTGPGPGPIDGGQVQILRFIGTPAGQARGPGALQR
jgi:hypothetical protein